jgi:hypothetical protein
LEALLTFSKWNTLIGARLLAVLFSLAGTAAIFGEIQNTPREFAPGVVSTGHEFGITFMPDGKEAYLSRVSAH